MQVNNQEVIETFSRKEFVNEVNHICANMVWMMASLVCIEEQSIRLHSTAERQNYELGSRHNRGSMMQLIYLPSKLHLVVFQLLRLHTEIIVH